MPSNSPGGKNFIAGIAQLVERGPSKSNVACSNHVARFLKKVNCNYILLYYGITLVSWCDFFIFIWIIKFFGKFFT